MIYRHWLPRLISTAHAVITISQCSKVDIVRYLPVALSKVHVIPEGVNANYRPALPTALAEIRTRYGLPEHFLLFVGSVEERKNLRRLLEACELLWRAGEHRPLVVAGARLRKHRGINETLTRLGLERRVVLTGYVPEADLPALYSAADLFVFPSLYEGFGLPPLEAMACGAPVGCSNSSSLPEVVGDAAVTVDPYDVEALAHAMHRVLSDANLRDELRAKGLARAAQFTWERTAQETMKVYQSVL